MNGFATGEFLATVAVSAAVVLVLILATWFVARAVGRFNVIDVAWGLGFVVVAWVAYASGALAFTTGPAPRTPCRRGTATTPVVSSWRSW